MRNTQSGVIVAAFEMDRANNNKYNVVDVNFKGRAVRSLPLTSRKETNIHFE